MEKPVDHQRKLKTKTNKATIAVSYEENAPEYRSVMIGESRSFDGEITATAGVGGGVLSSLKSAVGSRLKSWPSTGSKHQKQQQQQPHQQLLFCSSSTERGGEIAVPKASSSSSPPPFFSSSRWIVRNLKELPSDYNLVRTNVCIEYARCDPQEIADKICNTLKSLSVTAIDNDELYDEALFEGERNILLAETQYGMKFAIRLFKSSYNHHHLESNDNDHHRAQLIVVVELKRTMGCSLEFRNTAKLVLESLLDVVDDEQNEKTIIDDDNNPNNNYNDYESLSSLSISLPSQQAPTTTKSSSCAKFGIPSYLPKRSIDDRRKSIEDDVKNCCRNLLASTQVDTQVLALEGMERITSNIIGIDGSSIAARCVLGHCDCLCRLILNEEDDDDEVEVDDEDNNATSYNYHHESFGSINVVNSSYRNVLPSLSLLSPSSTKLVRRKVLTILANSFEAIIGSSEDEFDTILSAFGNDYNGTDLIKSKSFLSLLLRCIKDASSSPHDAYQAVRCLRYLLTLSSTKDKAFALIQEMNGAMDIISNMQRNSNTYFDECYHDGLERERSILIAQIENRNTTTNSINSNLVC